MTPDLLTPPKEMDSLSMEGLESAPGGWFDCEVQKAGPAEDGTIFIGLRATPTMKREMLATALAALSGRKVVNVSLTSTDEYSVINRMYVVA